MNCQGLRKKLFGIKRVRARRRVCGKKGPKLAQTEPHKEKQRGDPGGLEVEKKVETSKGFSYAFPRGERARLIVEIKKVLVSR